MKNRNAKLGIKELMLILTIFITPSIAIKESNPSSSHYNSLSKKDIKYIGSKLNGTELCNNNEMVRRNIGIIGWAKSKTEKKLNIGQVLENDPKYFIATNYDEFLTAIDEKKCKLPSPETNWVFFHIRIMNLCNFPSKEDNGEDITPENPPKIEFRVVRNKQYEKECDGSETESILDLLSLGSLKQLYKIEFKKVDEKGKYDYEVVKETDLTKRQTSLDFDESKISLKKIWVYSTNETVSYYGHENAFLMSGSAKIISILPLSHSMGQISEVSWIDKRKNEEGFELKKSEKERLLNEWVNPEGIVIDSMHDVGYLTSAELKEKGISTPTSEYNKNLMNQQDKAVYFDIDYEDNEENSRNYMISKFFKIELKDGKLTKGDSFNFEMKLQITKKLNDFKVYNVMITSEIDAMVTNFNAATPVIFLRRSLNLGTPSNSLKFLKRYTIYVNGYPKYLIDGSYLMVHFSIQAHFINQNQVIVTSYLNFLDKEVYLIDSLDSINPSPSSLATTKYSDKFTEIFTLTEKDLGTEKNMFIPKKGDILRVIFQADTNSVTGNKRYSYADGEKMAKDQPQAIRFILNKVIFLNGGTMFDAIDQRYSEISSKEKNCLIYFGFKNDKTCLVCVPSFGIKKKDLNRLRFDQGDIVLCESCEKILKKGNLETKEYSLEEREKSSCQKCQIMENDERVCSKSSKEYIFDYYLPVNSFPAQKINEECHSKNLNFFEKNQCNTCTKEKCVCNRNQELITSSENNICRCKIENCKKKN